MDERQRPGRDAPSRMTSYDDARASFDLEVPSRCNPVLDIVERLSLIHI